MLEVGYARVSSQEQRDGGTIELQLHALRQHYAARGVPDPVIITDDGTSGMLPLHDRPGGARVLAAAAENPNVRVTVWKLDRLGRDVGDTVTAARQITRAGGKIASITEGVESGTPSGDFMLSIYASVAQLERDNLIARTTAGRQRVAREGLWVFGAPPYGYRVHEKRLVVHEEEAAIVRRIYQRTLDGLGARLIADELNAMGVPSRRTRWSKSTVKKILDLPTYRGEFRLGWSKSGGRRHQAVGQAPAIIDAETARLVDEREGRGGHNRRRDYPLTGRISCALCGAPMHGEFGKRHPYYTCSRHSPGGCEAIGVRADVLEAVAWEDLRAFLTSPERLQEWADATLTPPPAPEPGIDLAEQRRRLEGERARIAWMFQQGDLSTGDYQDRMSNWRSRSAALARLEAAGRARPEEAAVRDALDAARALAAALSDPEESLKSELLARLLLSGSVRAPAPEGRDRYGRTRSRLTYRGTEYLEGVRSSCHWNWTLTPLTKAGQRT